MLAGSGEHIGVNQREIDGRLYTINDYEYSLFMKNMPLTHKSVEITQKNVAF